MTVQTPATTVERLAAGTSTPSTPHGDVTARRLHVCDVAGGPIRSVTTDCNGGWDANL